jgi:hypothetical protein
MNNMTTFVGQIYNFLQTITIFNPYIAKHYSDKIETALAGLEILPDDKLPDNYNPYFLHLQGLHYHADNFADNDAIFGAIAELLPECVDDEPFTVRSIDNPALLPITFDRATLESPEQAETLKYYKYDTEARGLLYTKYPEQVDLIKGILFPAELVFNTEGAQIGKCTNVSRFKLIQYEQIFLEDNEYPSIIAAIEEFLDMFRARWDVPEYMEFERFSHLVLWTMVWALLPMVVLKQRIANMHTSSVHTDLIWEYLTSKGIGDYRDILLRDQQLFLYKNIRYLYHTKGTDRALQILADKLLKPFDITLASKLLVLDVNGSGVQCLPTASIVTKDVAAQYTPLDPVLNPKEHFRYAYQQEVLDGIEPDYGPELYQEQYGRLSRARVSKLPTKLMEFVNENINFHDGVEFIRFSIETMFYMLSLGRLEYNITIQKDLVVGGLTLTIPEAIALLAYSLANEESPTFLLTASNIEAFVGKRIIYDDRYIDVTNDNKLSLIGIIAELAAPFDIPTQTRLTRPYVDNIDIDALQRSLKIGIDDGDDPDTHKYVEIDDIAEFLNKEIIVNGEPVTIDLLATKDGLVYPTVQSQEDLLEVLENRFEIRLYDMYTARTRSNMSFHRCFDRLYEQITLRQVVTLPLVDEIGYDNYPAWFESNASLYKLINSIDAKKRSKLGYINLSNDIIENLVSLLNSKFVKFGSLSSEGGRLMRKLFVQLCSYDIVFFNANTSVKPYEMFSPIAYNDFKTIGITNSEDIDVQIDSPYMAPIYTVNENAVEPTAMPPPVYATPEKFEQPAPVPPTPALLVDRSYGSPIEGNYMDDLIERLGLSATHSGTLDRMYLHAMACLPLLHGGSLISGIKHPVLFTVSLSGALTTYNEDDDPEPPDYYPPNWPPEEYIDGPGPLYWW